MFVPPINIEQYKNIIKFLVSLLYWLQKIEQVLTELRLNRNAWAILLSTQKKIIIYKLKTAALYFCKLSQLNNAIIFSII